MTVYHCIVLIIYHFINISTCKFLLSLRSFSHTSFISWISTFFCYIVAKYCKKSYRGLHKWRAVFFKGLGSVFFTLYKLDLEMFQLTRFLIDNQRGFFLMGESSNYRCLDYRGLFFFRGLECS